MGSPDVTATAAPGSPAARRTQGTAWRVRADRLFEIAALSVLVVALAALAALIADILLDGASRLSLDFITRFSSRRASQAGIWHALTGTVAVVGVTAALAVPIGMGAAIYLEEYGGRRRLAERRQVGCERRGVLLGRGFLVEDRHGVALCGVVVGTVVPGATEPSTPPWHRRCDPMPAPENYIRNTP